MSQNLCLICCYSFPAKRSRFISNDTRESFQKFCGELGLRFLDGDGSKTQKIDGLVLPFGDRITVCGDCLSLVVLYVHGRTVQAQKEEKVRELQKAVSAALKNLQEVVKEVQGHIDELHNTMSMGDASCLDSICGVSSSLGNKENNPSAFRAKVLKLNTGFIKAKTVLQKDGSDSISIPINIKVEPRNQVNSDAEDAPTFEEATDFKLSKVSSSTSAPFSEEYYGEVSADFSPSPDSNFDNFSDSCDKHKDTNNTKKAKKRVTHSSKYAPPKRSKKPEETSMSSTRREESNLTTLQWKDSLISRILMQMNDDIYQEDSDLSQQNGTYGGGGDETTKEDDPRGNDAKTSSLTSSSFQFVDGKLNLGGIVVNIREDQRALQCTKCGKNFFEERDVTGGSPLETLMRDHILWKHYGEFQRQYVKNEWREIQPISDSELKESWRIKSRQKLKSAHITHYYCALGKRYRKETCPVMLKRIAHTREDDIGDEVEVEVEFQINEKEHQNHKAEYFGLTPADKTFIEDLVDKNVRVATPNYILRMFRKHGRTEPPKTKLKNFLHTLRGKKRLKKGENATLDVATDVKYCSGSQL